MIMGWERMAESPNIMRCGSGWDERARGSIVVRRTNLSS